MITGGITLCSRSRTKRGKEEQNGIFSENAGFLFENRLNNSREWFEAHKEDYRRLVLEPLQELVRALTPCALKIDGEFVTEPRVDRTICRIRRDAVFPR